MILPSFSDVTAACNRAAPILLDAALRATLILALAGLATASWRPASAAARHYLWFLALLSLLVLPILSATLPAWNILPHAASNIVPSHILSTIPSSSAAQPPPQLPHATSPQELPQTASASSPLPRTNTSPNSPTPPWTFCLLFLWFIGASLILLHTLLGHISLALLQRHCTRLHTEESASQITRLQKHFALRRPILLLSSTRRTMPMTWGIFRPRILLPEEANQWPTEKSDTVLLHELAHIRRHDCAAQLIAQLVCALYWFNPLVWIAWNRMQFERERACDDLVLNTGARPSDYAHHLLKSAASMPTLPFVNAAAAMARPSTLEERLRAILDPQRNRSTMNIKNTSAATLLLLIALFPIALLHAQDASSTPPPARRTSPATRPLGAMPSSRMFSGSTALADTEIADTAGPTCMMDVTIYDVRLPADQLGLLDRNDLAKTATTAAGFEKALAVFGPIQPLYRVNQSVRLNKDRIIIGTQVPVITNSQATANGKTINSVSYQNTGAIFTLAGKTLATGNVDLNLDIELSAISDGGTPISDNVKATLFRTATLSSKGRVTPDQPFVILSFNGGTRDEAGRAVAYIARVTLGTPQTDTPAP